MSTEKMRAEFEKWECDADQGPQTDPAWLMYDANTKAYPLDKIQSRWEVWQACYASIEVELPEEFPEDGHGPMVMMSHHVRTAIESLGLRVKT